MSAMKEDKHVRIKSDTMKSYKRIGTSRGNSSLVDPRKCEHLVVVGGDGLQGKN